MNRTFWKAAFGISLALLALPSDVLAGRGGGRGGGGGGGGGSRGGGDSRGGGGGYGGGGGGGSRGGGMGGTPSFSQPHQSTNQSRSQGNTGSGGRSSSGNRSPQGDQSGSGTRSQSGNAAGAANRNQSQSPSNAGAAGAGAAKRNQSQSPSNAGAAAAGAGAANRNQPNNPNAGAAAAGAGYANRNQPNNPNAGAAAAGAGYANRNQPNYPNAGAAAAGAGYANRNQPNYPNAGAAAAGAAYANNNQYHPGLVNGTWNGNNSAAWGATGSGLGAATGVGAWGTGSPMYSYGYSGYNNPYSGTPSGSGGGSQPVAAQQPGDAPPQAAAPAYNYSQPISTTAAPPAQPVADQATTAFDQAREAFKAGDYAQALQLDQQALTQMPNDTTLHEFLALVLFAQGKYEQAAAPLYAVLSVGPGWDWTTLSGMYPDVATYTGQLRNLEAYIDANPKSAHARFVLAYQYLCEGHDENALAQLKEVVKLQPGDTLSAQLVARSQPSGGTQPSAADPAAAPAVDGKLAGRWAAAPAKDAKIVLAIQDDGAFTWDATGPGKPPMRIKGTSTIADGVLSLADQGGQNGALAGKVIWQDADHFTFRLLGAQPEDPGLKFIR
jgi:hypothetical protein